MFARSERRRARTLEDLKIQSLGFASFGPDIVDGRLSYAIHDQAHTVATGLQFRIVVTAIGRCMDLSNFICIAPLDADFSTLDRLTRGIFHDPAQSGLSGLSSQH